MTYFNIIKEIGWVPLVLKVVLAFLPDLSDSSHLTCFVAPWPDKRCLSHSMFIKSSWCCTFYLRCFSKRRSSSGFTRSVLPSTTLFGCLICVICNSKSFHSFLFKLCIMLVLILKICAHFMNIFSFLRGVELRHFFCPKDGVWFV